MQEDNSIPNVYNIFNAIIKYLAAENKGSLFQVPVNQETNQYLYINELLMLITLL